MRPQAIYLDDSKSEQQVPLLPAHVEPEPAPPANDRRSKCMRKGLRFLATGVFLWLAFKVLSDHFVYFGGYHSKASTSASMDWRVPPDVNLEECATWQGDVKPRGLGRVALYDPYTASASFALPISSEKLFLLSRGAASGSLKVRHGGDNEDVEIGVIAHYRDEDALETVQVCTLSRGEGENGFGIFGPERWSGRNRVNFAVTLHLPKGHDGSVLYVNDFATDFPLFAHQIGDLHGHVHFDSISLKSSNSPIVVESLGAEKAEVKTSNSPIDGTFNVSSSLKLVTSNSHVHANVNLYNDEEKAVTDLLISTSNAPIKSTLQLASAQKAGGKFKIGISTSNAPLDLNFSDAPVNSVLLLDAHTSVSRATVQLHKTFDGTFDISSSLKRPVVVWEGNPEDPAGEGRTRKVAVDVRGSTVSGSARWSGSDELIPGRVSVTTSLSPLTLKL
ncbi:hypothetical protein DXG03_005456 [Asterophora parasitica]|uniref:Uncharacterized protein n=1 Tax=Asterophora parasitica TaxID=117018 RepID=A0A9P7G5T4_9AGAR|nr:hypothetical protein DXG03_005456 [Asterophora parasitica]